MNICIVSKYPPIQGGMSARAFWLSKGLAEKGHRIYVVTNADCVEKEYFIDDSFDTLPSNLSIHNVAQEIPWHIPYSKLYIASLLNKTLEIVDEHKIDLIDAHYLVPYGIVGYLVSKIRGIPYVVRHGGSDLEKFWEKGTFRHILEEVIRNASVVISDDKNKELFKKYNKRINVLPRYIPDERYFKPLALKHKMPTFAYIGKFNYHWRYKSLDKIINIFSGVKGDYKLLFVGQGKGAKDFSEYTKDYNLKSGGFKKFVHPAKMPELLCNVDFILNFLQDSPIKDFSNIVCEAFWAGIPLITDKALDVNMYTDYVEIDSKKQVIRLPLDELEKARNIVNKIISGWNGGLRYNSIKYNFDCYIDVNLKMYHSAIKGKDQK